MHQCKCLSVANFPIFDMFCICAFCVVCLNFEHQMMLVLLALNVLDFVMYDNFRCQLPVANNECE